MYKKIMVPLDGSELAECVLSHVQAIASGCRVPSVELVRVVEPIQLPTRGGIALSANDLKRVKAEMKGEAENYLEKITARLKGAGLHVQTKLLEGKAAEQLVEHARSSKADLLIMASHGASGVTRWVWGSVTDRILRSSSVPVLLIRAPGCAPGKAE